MGFYQLASRVTDSADGGREPMDKEITVAGARVPARIVWSISEANRMLSADPALVFVGQFADYFALAEKAYLPAGVRYADEVVIGATDQDALPHVADSEVVGGDAPDDPKSATDNELTAWLRRNATALAGDYFAVEMPEDMEYVVVKDGVPVPVAVAMEGVVEVGPDAMILVEVLGGTKIGLVDELMHPDDVQHSIEDIIDLLHLDVEFDEDGNITNNDHPADPKNMRPDSAEPVYDGMFKVGDGIDAPAGRGAGATMMSDIGHNRPGAYPARKHTKDSYDPEVVQYADYVISHAKSAHESSVNGAVFFGSGLYADAGVAVDAGLLSADDLKGRKHQMWYHLNERDLLLALEYLKGRDGGLLLSGTDHVLDASEDGKLLSSHSLTAIREALDDVLSSNVFKEVRLEIDSMDSRGESVRHIYSITMHGRGASEESTYDVTMPNGSKVPLGDPGAVIDTVLGVVAATPFAEHSHASLYETTGKHDFEYMNEIVDSARASAPWCCGKKKVNDSKDDLLEEVASWVGAEYTPDVIRPVYDFLDSSGYLYLLDVPTCEDRDIWVEVVGERLVEIEDLIPEEVSATVRELAPDMGEDPTLYDIIWGMIMAASLTTSGDALFDRPIMDSKDRGICVFPKESEDVNDGQDHFPINNVKQARAALTYVNQYTEAPAWYSGKGGVQAMVDKVVRMVHKRFPEIDISEAAKVAK